MHEVILSKALFLAKKNKLEYAAVNKINALKGFNLDWG